MIDQYPGVFDLCLILSNIHNIETILYNIINITRLDCDPMVKQTNCGVSDNKGT